jgi:hypothetical protein
VRNIFDTDEQWEVNSVLADWTEAGPAAVRGTTAGRFPADRDNLFAFDLVVLGELPARFFKTDELEWLRDFVGNRGGGLVLLDGRRDSLRGYPGTALEPLLPVEWLRDPVAFRVTRLRPAATQAAQAMLLLTDEPGGNAALWSKFPLPHWNTATKALPGSEILLEAQAPSGECFPAMVLRRFGCGSVLYVAGDELWRLRFNADDRYHSRLWHQMATGLMEKPFTVSDRRVSLDSGPLSYRPGARVEIRARLRDDQGRPLADPHAAVQLWRDGRQVAHLPLVADPNQGGLLRAVSGALESGAYTVRVEATEIPAAEIKVETSFTVAPPDAGELALLRCQDALLRQMATQTGGRFLREDALGLLPDLVKPLNEGQLIEDETLLWQSYFWFVPIILLLVLEWVLRKKAGLL